MLNKLIFYNHFGAGDLFESREFVKAIMRLIPANQYIYAHNKNPKMFIDIPELDYMPTTIVTDPKKAYVSSNKDLYINTWIGRDSKYVLYKIGCTVGKNFEMFNDILKASGHKSLAGTALDYLPTVDYSYFNTDSIDKFISKKKNKYKAIVLVCNGKIFSEQAYNFDFSPTILDLACKRKDTLFLTTEHVVTKMTNLSNTANIIKTDDGFDLNEIAYLATKVDVIVGRKSGTFCFAHTKDVWYSNKKSLSFTYTKQASHFVLEDTLPLRKYWSDATDIKKVTDKVNFVLED